MDAETVVATLDFLAELQCQRQLIEMDKQALANSILTPEIRQALAEIDAEFIGKFSAVDEKITAITESVKAAAVEMGESVKGARLQAVFTKGRTSWNTKALDGYAAAHSEIAQFKTVGEPSVSIRAVK